VPAAATDEPLVKIGLLINDTRAYPEIPGAKARHAPLGKRRSRQSTEILGRLGWAKAFDYILHLHLLLAKPLKFAARIETVRCPYSRIGFRNVRYVRMNFDGAP